MGEWCSVQEAAELLGVSTETIRKRIKDGTLRGRKEGRRYLVSRQDLERYLANIRPRVGQAVEEGRSRAELEMELRFANEKIELLQEQVEALKERIRDLESDKGFLLEQLKEKDRIIKELMPRALPKPRERGWLRRLFKRSKGKGEKA